MIKLSIILPFYNVEQYIEECIRSLYNQDISLEEYEVICVNDCSPDNSVDVVKRLQKEFSNFILIEHLENKKLGGARNTGLKYAKGDYIWFVDSDDMIKPNSLGLIIKYITSNNLDFLHFGWDEFNDVHLIESDKIQSTDILTGTELFFNERFVWWKNHITAWCKVYKKSFLIENNIHFAEYIMYEDNDYALKVYSSAKRCMHISENLYLYRVNNDSITRIKYNSQHILYWLLLNKRLIELNNDFIKKRQDNRYISLIYDFVRNNFYQCISVYKKLSLDDKFRVKEIFKKEIDTSFIKYISLKNYIKCKIRFL